MSRPASLVLVHGAGSGPWVYHSDQISFPGLDHWDLVLDPRVRAAVAEWLGVAAG